MARLTRPLVESLKPEGGKDRVVWDADLKGFGLRVGPNSKTYLIQYRNAEGSSRRLAIGKHPILSPDQARKLALKKLGAVAGGDDPVEDKRRIRAGRTVAQICDWYLEEAEAGRLLGRSRKPLKASTLKNDRARIEQHIKPLLGSRSLRTLTLGDIERMQAEIAQGSTRAAKRRKGRGASAKGGEGVAGRTVATLRAILGHARRWELIDRNPALGVRQIASKKRTRRLSEEEISALGAAIREAQRLGENPVGLAAVTLMLMTGLRRGEALGLRYEWLAERAAHLPDTKTGPQTRALGRAAMALVESQKRNERQAFVFPSDRAETYFIAADKTIARLCHLAGLKDVTLHTLRHTFASVAADLGYSELTIAGLLGHASLGVTQRYVHLDKALVVAADEVSAHMVELLLRPSVKRPLAA